MAHGRAETQHNDRKGKTMNRVIICGNLGQDPELRNTANGTAVCNLNVATNSRVKQGDEWVDEVEWHRVTAWSGQAESCAKYLTRGRKVLVEGRLKTRKWTDKQGVEKYSTDIIADRVHFVGGREDGDSNRGDRPNGNRRPSGNRSGGGGYGGSNRGGAMTDDIPF
jgi:single-strand DNA-binding protein